MPLICQFLTSREDVPDIPLEKIGNLFTLCVDIKNVGK